MKVFYIISSLCLINCESGLDKVSYLRKKYNGELDNALADIITSFPASNLAIVFDHTLVLLLMKFMSTDGECLIVICDVLLSKGITLFLFNVSTVARLDQYFSFLSTVVSNHLSLHILHFVNKRLAEHVLVEIKEGNFIRSNIYYMFYWGENNIQRYFLRNIHEAMKIILITNPRHNAYRIYFNQATAYRKHHLTMVNWWTKPKRLFNHHLLPSAAKIFKDFNGKLIYVPVIHKPPWHFVRYKNNSFEVMGGRDDKLLRLLAETLNFRYEYIDPPERIQGSSFSLNGSFEGVLGLVWRREVELFLGDVALTWERSNVVEFSFLTLADSGAFVTHAPDTLNEAFALIRPFHWKVWPAIILTFCISGPILYALIVIPNLWQPRFLIKSHSKLFYDCVWYTTSIFLRQSEKEPNKSHKARFFIILLTTAATYVIGDMYSANLTSLLAKPEREKSINNLVQLEEAMRFNGFQLFVEKYSSTYSLLENGTSIYGKLWNLMNTMQTSYLVNSVEDGVKMVRDFSEVAVIAGRETLFFDIQRFGATNFHLSEKINTAYSAIAFQLGCPYIETINKILMAIFEAGILTKMTENEYEKLGKQQLNNRGEVDEDLVLGIRKETRKIVRASETNVKLKAINIKMLQGAFYLLFIGYLTAAITLFLEIIYKKQSKKFGKNRTRRFGRFKRIRRTFLNYVQSLKAHLRRRLRRFMNEAIISTLEYIE